MAAPDKTVTVSRLVKALLPEEAAKVEMLLAAKHGKDKSTQRLTLFRHFSSSSSESQKDAIESLGKDTKKETYRVVLNGLEKTVLSVLRDVVPEDNNSRQFHFLMDKGYIYQGKGLLDEAWKVFKEAATFAASKNLYSAEILASNAMLWITQVTQGKDNIKTANELTQRIRRKSFEAHLIAEGYAVYLPLVSIAHRSYLLRAKQDIETVTRLRNDGFLHQKPDASWPTPVQAYHALSQMWLAVFDGDLESAFGHIDGIRSVISQRLKDGQATTMEIIAMYVDYLPMCVLARKYEAFNEAVEEFKVLREKLLPSEVNYQGIEVQLRSQALFETGTTDLKHPVHETLLSFYTSRKGELTPIVARGMLWQMGQLYRVNSYYTNAINWIDELAHVKSTTTTNGDLVLAARMFHITLLFERDVKWTSNRISFKNDAFAIRSKQYLESIRKWKDNYAIEKAFFLFFSKFPLKLNAAEYDELLSELRDTMNELLIDEQNLYGRILMRFFDVREWVCEARANHMRKPNAT